MNALDPLLQRAAADGLLPAGTPAPDADARPWPVVLLTALGAWLAAVPLLIVVGLLFGDFISRSAGAYVVGLAVLAGSVVVLRSRDLPLFAEQLAVPGLLVGGGTLAFGLFRDLPEQAAAAMLAAIVLALVLALPRGWLRVLLGATGAGLVGLMLVPIQVLEGRIDTVWLVLHGLVLIWAAAMAWQRRALEHGTQARLAAAVEAAGAGWLLLALAGLAWFAGSTFLVGGAMGGGFAAEVARELGHRSGFQGLAAARGAASAGLAVLGMAFAARAWPPLRRPALAGVALVLAGLGFLLPTLGAVLLALALCAVRHRFLLAAAAGVAAAWILGSFYYNLGWPLAHKAAMLVAAGAALGLMAWGLSRSASPPSEPAASAPRLGRAAAWLALGTVAPLAVAAVGIWQKEDLIRHGQPVFVPLAPVDPRSLMQGDYMQLNFRLPREDAPPPAGGGRPWAVATRDARGVATVLRVSGPGSPLAADEFPIELTLRRGDWVLVTDAWYFKEGDADRWATARFGEFRVAPDGRALLVGMADAELRPLRPDLPMPPRNTP